ncbi:type II secretion system F family protein [Methanoculleus sp. 7T]|uniref:type II secretion system F family protein n=1 Tax=Methanoculleus sp. 7T TaxID=2937282 RepID=UPI0020C0B28E|nr:type II secretion system F family protein [Methanoculleus sp. 7T]MCK8518994.1 type II secretion system F family protein [Methanoculleus sp. 7T]
MNSYERFCFNLIGRGLKEKRGDYVSLRNDLVGARMNTPFEAYLATAYVSSVGVGLVAAMLIGLFTYLLRIPEMITYRGAVPEFFYALNDYKLLLGTIIITVLSLLIFGGISYLIFLLYPGIRAGERRRNIDATLPYAINYVTAMSSAGITPDEVFRLLGQSKIYGESAVEARYVSRETDFFGKDLLEALRTVSQATPSERMREFLQGSVASISSGSNLTEYFRTKAHQYALENNQQQKTFLETLGLIAEAYVTAMVAGMLFLIILQSVMTILSGDANPFFLYIIIYLIVPFGSMMFVILISSMTPEV